MKVFFIYLAAFCQTGGIEKFNRAFMKAAEELWGENFFTYSVYDSDFDKRYISEENFKGFNKRKFLFIKDSLIRAYHSDYLVIGHIKLAVIGLIIKLFDPNKKIFLIVHGIDVWGKLSYLQKLFIENYCDCIMSVSKFTKSVIVKQLKILEEKVKVFPNTIDPFFSLPKEFHKPDYLKKRYDINHNDFIILTLCRLSSTEGFKGYDKVLNILPDLLKTLPNVKYLLVGKYDDEEKKRIENLLLNLNLTKNVILTGFINESELIDHYLLADVFIMPSKKEGFGIVFIEAMACGIPTIAGNKDGSVDALLNGELGCLINPDDHFELIKGISSIHKSRNNEIESKILQEKVIDAFGFDSYKERLKLYFETE